MEEERNSNIYNHPEIQQIWKLVSSLKNVKIWDKAALQDKEKLVNINQMLKKNKAEKEK